jgi:hypothetical protein
MCGVIGENSLDNALFVICGNEVTTPEINGAIFTVQFIKSHYNRTLFQEAPSHY